MAELTVAGDAVGKKRNDSPGDRRAVVLTMKGNPEFKAWLQRLAEHCGLSVSATVAMALRRFARSQGFDETPPRR